MPTKKSGMSSTTLLSVAVGLFLVLSGVLNLIDSNSLLGKMGGVFQSDLSKTVGIVSAILKIVSGAVLVIGPFGLLTKGIRQLAFWIIVVFWAALTLWLAFTTVNALKGSTADALGWFEALFLDLAILAALWHLNPED
jgi:hypothetical protein